MTPEEIEAFRGWCRMFEVSADSMIMKALNHIDQQATALDEAEALIKKNADQINALLAQVAALQEIAVSERANTLFNGPWDGGLPASASYDATMAKAKEDARRQLHTEHPEAFGTEGHALLTRLEALHAMDREIVKRGQRP